MTTTVFDRWRSRLASLFCTKPGGFANGRRRQRVRASAILIWTGLSFASVQLGLALAIELWIPGFRDPYYADKASRLQSRLRGDPKPLSVVALGSSRTVFGFKSNDIEERLTAKLGQPVTVFNFGIPGAGPVYEQIVLRRLLATGIKPDLVLLEVLPALLADVEQAPAEACWLVSDRFSRGEIKKLQPYHFATREMQRDWLVGWADASYLHRFAILSYLAPAWLPRGLRQDWFHGIDASGWVESPQAQPTPEQRQHATDVAREEYYQRLSSLTLDSTAMQAFIDLLELCRSRGIRAMMILMPEAATFRDWYPAPVWAEIEKRLAELSARYDIPVINARTWVPDESFGDPHHLRVPGAVIFSERLCREVLEADFSPVPRQANRSIAISRRDSPP